MSAVVDYTLTGYACPCCVENYFNAECSCEYHGDDCSREHAPTGHYTLDVDLDNEHFGRGCVVCNDYALAGSRYDVTLTAWR